MRKILISAVCLCFVGCADVRTTTICDVDEETEAMRYRILESCTVRVPQNFRSSCEEIAQDVYPGKNCQTTFMYIKTGDWYPCEDAEKNTIEYSNCKEEMRKHGL